jgi:hypothetical protein
MKKLVSLLIVLAISLPSYGVILVYNLQMNFRGAMNGLAIVDANSIYDESYFLLIQKRTSKAFLVLDVNEVNEPEYVVENAGIIPYSTVSKKYIDDASVDLGTISLYRFPNRNAKYHHLWMLDFSTSNSVVEVATLNTQDVEVYNARIVGKALTDTKLVSINYDGEVAPTMKGCALLDALSDPELGGTTTVTASLDTRFTQLVNNIDPILGRLTFADVVDELKSRLEQKGYTAR